MWASIVLVLTTVFVSQIAPVAAGIDAWHLDYIPAIATEQLDPVLFPNQQAGHMHKIFGGSNFRAGYSYDLYKNAECSSASLQPDKSNYWMPQMYWYNATAPKPYTPLRINFRFYYRLARSSPKQYVSPFPEGLRLMGGNMAAKAPASYMYFMCQTERNKPGYPCNGFKCGTECPYGVKVVVLLPQCWDGIHLWKTDMSHMSYPVNLIAENVQNGQCPFSHPIRVPQILLEGTWFPSEVAPGHIVDDHLIWSFGDTTGFGAHGDFVNGWDTDLLAKALTTPGSCVDLPNGEIAIQECEVFKPYYDEAAAKACRPAVGELKEPTGNADKVPIEKLPGCNLPWTSGPKPTCNPPVPRLDLTGFTTPMGPEILPEGQRQNFKWPTERGWHNIGCFISGGTFNSTDSYTYIDKQGLTGDSCRAACVASGYTFAGLQKRGVDWTCTCAKQLLDTAPVYPGMCDLPCPGGKGTCGGYYALDVWWAGPDVTYTEQKNATATSQCIPDSADGLAQHATYSFITNSMTPELCMSTCKERNATWALTRTGATCLCGSGSSMYSSNFAPNSLCSLPCKGDPQKTCGGPGASSYYSLSSSTAGRVSNGAVLNGCYTEVSGLSAYSVYLGNTMTIETCTSTCAEAGYSLAGLNGGTTCNCGNSWTGTPSTSDCSVACKGNSSQTCGGASAQAVYDVSDVTPPKRPANFQGCYSDPSEKVIAGSFFQSTGLTPELCARSCGGQGFAVAGVKSGNKCFCSSAPTSNAIELPPAACDTVACTGDSTQSCGGAAAIAVYGSTTSSTTTKSGSVYMGCYVDGAVKLSAYQQQSNAMTLEMCESTCAAKGARYFGLRLGNICHCGDNAAKQIVDSSVCSKPCAGDASETCGAPTNAAISVYDLKSATISKPPVRRVERRMRLLGRTVVIRRET